VHRFDGVTPHLLTWREIDLGGVVLIGLVAGYVMALAGLWAGRVPGLVAFDIADFGRRYVVADRPSAWFFGMASHLANSILLTMMWAMFIEPSFGFPRILEGIGWGVVLTVTLAGGLIAPMSGLGLMGWKTHSPSFALTNLLLHVMWGAMVGALYVPR
jgi:hypothetical protein